jgi:hypothetical protein
MCVRTKSSYGCGHTYKQDESCHRSSCAGLERYHFEKEGDCRQCRRGGGSVSRGREGQGRYARELSKKDQKPYVTRVPLAPISTNGQPSPWAPASRREKDWRSPIRKQADEAWEEEHARREEDLQSRSPGSRSGGSVRSDPESPQHLREDQEAAIREELRKFDGSERIRIRRRRDRQTSYDSIDSFGESYRSHGSSGLYSQGHSSARRSHESGGSSGRSRMYDSGFNGGSNKHAHGSPYNLYNTESYFRGLGQGFGDLVRDSGRKLARW